jgi:hypothetical protein
MIDLKKQVSQILRLEDQALQAMQRAEAAEQAK